MEAEMEKKRSAGVSILGILTVLGGVIGLLVMLDPQSFIGPYKKPFGTILYALSGPLTVFEIVLGVNVLKLKEWARKYLLILTTVYVVTIFLLPFLEDRNYSLAMAEKMVGEMKITLKKVEIAYRDYEIKTASGEPVLLRVDYQMPEERIANVALTLPEPKPDGRHSYEILSKEGETIIAEFFFEGGVLNNVRLDTPFRPPAGNTPTDKVFTIVSADQKDILLTFSWNDDTTVKNVNIQPKEKEFQTQDLFKDMTPEQRAQMEKLEADLPSIVAMVFKVVEYVLLGFLLLFYLITLFFFTRPKVKEQFS